MMPDRIPNARRNVIDVVPPLPPGVRTSIGPHLIADAPFDLVAEFNRAKVRKAREMLGGQPDG